MKFGNAIAGLALALLPLQANARALIGKPRDFIIHEERAPLQDIVRCLTGRKVFYSSEYRSLGMNTRSLSMESE